MRQTAIQGMFRKIESIFIDGKDSNRVAGGLKAAIHNPNVSETAKAHAHERLDEMGYDDPSESTGHETNRTLGGYKSTLTVSSRLS